MKFRERIIDFQNMAEAEFVRNKSFISFLNYGTAFIIFFGSTIFAAFTLPFRVLWKCVIKNKSQKIIDANSTNIDKIINQKAFVLIDFWAEWCGPCMLMNSIVEEFSMYTVKVQVVKVNADLNMKTLKKLNVRGLPHFLLYENGKEVNRKAGLMTLEELKKFCLEK